MYIGIVYILSGLDKYMKIHRKSLIIQWSLIHIAKRPPREPNRARSFSYCHRRPEDAHIKDILERPVAARRLVLHGARPSHHAGPRIRVEVLPDPPRPVDLPVVQPKDRVAGADVEVASRVARDGEVAPAVDAVVARLRVPLHARLERPDVCGLGDQVRRVLVRRPARADELGHVPPEAPRVVLEEVVLRHRGDVLLRQRRGDRAQVGRHVAEGPRRDAPAALTGRDAVLAVPVRVGAVVGHEVPVAAQAGGAAVEDGAVERVEGRLAPVPVRLCAFITAFFPQRRLVVGREDAVPGEEVGSPVDDG